MDTLISKGIEQVILPRTHDLGGFEVRRALPFRDRRMVGPFIFWDQMGPGEFLTGQGVDVRPHPHIGLSTVTYLFEGSLDHKDSLGNDRRIVPGDINLMTAGAGIVHSERTGRDIRLNPSTLFGIQSWIAQPKEFENGTPDFLHVPKGELPVFEEGGITGRVLLGDFQGEKSPIKTQWDTLYVDVYLEEGRILTIPAVAEERALYAITGKIEINHTVYDPEQMLILAPGDVIALKALEPTRLLVLGGAVMDGPRYIYWNFVSSSKERLEQAAEDWRESRFPKVPGDDKEFIPLPKD